MRPTIRSSPRPPACGSREIPTSPTCRSKELRLNTTMASCLSTHPSHLRTPRPPQGSTSSQQATLGPSLNARPPGVDLGAGCGIAMWKGTTSTENVPCPSWSTLYTPQLLLSPPQVSLASLGALCRGDWTLRRDDPLSHVWGLTTTSTSTPWVSARPSSSQPRHLWSRGGIAPQ